MKIYCVYHIDKTHLNNPLLSASGPFIEGQDSEVPVSLRAEFNMFDGAKGVPIADWTIFYHETIAPQKERAYHSLAFSLNHFPSVWHESRIGYRFEEALRLHTVDPLTSTLTLSAFKDDLTAISLHIGHWLMGRSLGLEDETTELKKRIDSYSGRSLSP